MTKLNFQHPLVKNKYTKMYLKYIYFMLSIIQIYLHIYVLNKNTLQLCGSSAEVQLKIYFSIFDCDKVELLQVYFRYTLNISYLKTDIIQKS